MRQRIDLDHVQRWVDGYLAAWDSNDPAAIKALFTPDGTYLDRPFGTPKKGHDAITADWLDRKDEPGTWQAWLEPLLVQGDTAIVTGKVDYTNGNRYANLWVIRFGDDGRAAEFTEWWMDRPSESAT
jgi:ketosteroid isomerase-like protein